MIRFFSIFLTVFMVLPSLAYAKEITADSKINAATVYTNRAKVTRVAKVTLPKGSHKVVFENLPVSLMANSLRAKGTAKADVVFGAVAHKRVMSRELTSAREKELNDQLQKLQDEVSLIRAETQALNDKKTFIKNVGRQANLRTDEAIAELNLHTEQWANAAEVIYKNISSIEKSKITIELKRRSLNKEMQRVRGELNQLRTGQRSTYKVSIPLEAAADTELTIELSYQVQNATWKPLYDARLTTAKYGALDILQYGAVKQRTGEDWTDVALTLSTAQPQRGTSLPDLTPLWVNIWKNNPRNMEQSLVMRKSASVGLMAPASNMAVNSAMEMDSVMGFAAEKTKRKARFVTAQINTGGFVSEYKIPGPSSILADGTETKLMIGTFDTDSVIQVHIKPQLSTEAFLVAKTKLKGESPILPGQVNLFRDGAYVGQSVFPLLRPAEEHGLYFGVDDQVAVKRKVLMDELKEVGMISKDKVQERHFVTEIQNLHTSAVEIVVKETTPVGRNERITADILSEYTTRGYEKDAVNIKGMLRWKFTMEPKSRKDLKLGWAVSWPKDFSINGL